MYSFLEIFLVLIVCIGLFLIITILYSKNTKLLKMISDINSNFLNLKEEIEELREKSQNKEQELKFSEDKLRLLSSQLIYTQEGERKRLARELHDGLGQNLIALKIYFTQLEQKIPKNLIELQELSKKIFKFIDTIIEEIRRMSRGLSPYLLEELGLSASLKHLTNELSHSNISITAEIDDIEALLGNESKIIIYRIVQEAFSNIAHHSNATHVNLSLKKDNNQIIVKITDDGKGFDATNLYKDSFETKRLGIISMEERAGMIGARLGITSREGYGTTITLTLNT